MATHQVLLLPELLENILLRLHTRDLLFAQKVCKTWKEVIEDSPDIQKALFFKAGVATDANNIIKIGTQFFSDDKSLTIAHNILLVACDGASLVLPHSLLDIRSEASCHRMYLTQPPVQLVANFSMWRSCEGEFRGRGFFSGTGTYGDLVEKYWGEVEYSQGLGFRLCSAKNSNVELWLF
ncbi:hypothetical protein LTR10_006256 [Elasticomyces elasticus]|nr:hypothetical protein LTR10_006256 [Elasticomyces elasticus]KAK4966694.1 hypothetical protein LTR42_011005 [Elasticomyces elasticus]